MKTLFAATVLFLASLSAFAADVWVVQGFAMAATSDPCFFTVWTGDVLFFNTTQSTVTIRLLGMSDAPSLAGQNLAFTIGPGQAATLSAKLPRAVLQPATHPAIWVDHLDVPDGVRMESRLELGESDCTLSPGAGSMYFGKLSFPVIRALSAPAQQQLFLGADNGATNNRVNIGVYDAGTVDATARIELHRACDDALLASQTATVPANSLRQMTLQRDPHVAPCADSRATPWANYATVTVDQPSLSYTTALTNTPLATLPLVQVPVSVSFSQ